MGDEILKIIGRFMKNLFLWIVSHIPVCTFSKDENYGTAQWDDFESEGKRKFRLSLFSICLGDSIWYFITYRFDEKKFSICYQLKLEECVEKSLNSKPLDDKIKRFSRHLQLLSENEIAIEKESLINRLKYEEDRISSSISKINMYNSILLAFLTIVVPIGLTKYTVYDISMFQLIIFALLCFTIFNLVMLVLSGMKVRAYYRSSFIDLKNSWQKSIEVILQYYYDWQQTQYKAIFFVSLVKNIEEWMVCFVIIVILSYVPMLSNNIKVPTNEIVGYDKVFNINIKEFDKPYSESATELAKLILDIEEQKKSKLIFITKHTENANELVNKLKKYDRIKYRILIDEHIGDDMLKVVWEEE